LLTAKLAQQPAPEVSEIVAGHRSAGARRFYPDPTPDPLERFLALAPRSEDRRDSVTVL
jgi:hypothetical protein